MPDSDSYFALMQPSAAQIATEFNCSRPSHYSLIVDGSVREEIDLWLLLALSKSGFRHLLTRG
jgi:hypothetical protein